MKIKRKFISQTKIAWLIVLCVVILTTLTLFWTFKTAREVKSPQTSIQKPVPKPKSLESKILFTGNSFWGRYTNDNAKKTESPYTFPFARLHEFERDKYDAWITGLECPTTEKGVSMTSAQMEATLTFNCDPAYLPEFKKWFTAVGLANNHTDNMGADGFEETKATLEKHDIQYFGHYDPYQIDDICEVISLPVRLTLDNNQQKPGELPIALCSYHFVFKLPQQEAIDKITEYAKVMPVIAVPHGGAEYKATPDQIKTDLYRSMIDAGADMVIGDHPHWIQSTEEYKGKLIVYSMGNFMFDQQFSSEVTRSAAIQIVLSTRSASSQQLEKWLKIGEACKKYHDDCLGQAIAAKLDKLDIEYKYGVIATNNKGYQTYPAPELQAGVERRLRWSETMQRLGQSGKIDL